MYLHSIVLKLYPSFPIKCSIIMGFFKLGKWTTGTSKGKRNRSCWAGISIILLYIYIYTLYKYKLLLYMKRCVPNMA